MEVDRQDASITLDDEEVTRFKTDETFRAKVIRRAQDMETDRTVLIMDSHFETLETVKTED